MFLAIDIGGTSIKYGLIDKNEKILHHFRLATNTSNDPKEIFSLIKKQLSEVIDLNEIEELGVCAPDLNPFSGELMSPPNLHWKDYHLKNIIREHFHQPLYLLNDADAFLLSELELGCAKGFENAVGLTLGTGVGTGVLSSNRLVLGGNQLGVEGGHITISGDGRICVCGIANHLEAYLSNQGICKTYEEISGNSIEYASDLIELSKSEESAKKTLKIISQQLGEGLANLYNIFSPEIFVIGGGNQVLMPLIEKELQAALNRGVFSPIKKDVSIKKASFSSIESSLYSAYSCRWRQKHF